MDWIAIILLALGLPLIGCITGTMMMVRKYVLMKNNPGEYGIEGEKEVRRNFGVLIIFQSLFNTGPIYGLLIVIIFSISIMEFEIPEGQLSKFGVAIAMAVGVPGLFANISRGLILKGGIESVVRDRINLGKTIVQAVIVETPMIYGLLIAILLLNFSGILSGEFLFSQYQIDEIFNAVIIFSCLSIGVLLSGVLLSRMEDPFSSSNFAKGIQKNVIGTFLPIVGLMYVIMKFSEIGIFTTA